MKHTIIRNGLFVAFVAAVLLCGCKKEEVDTYTTGGVFSVAQDSKVQFAKGNLRYNANTQAWSLTDHQYDYSSANNGDNGVWDYFGWSTLSTTYGTITSTDGTDYSGDFIDWGKAFGADWRTLSSDEWTYLLETRTVNGGTGDGHSYVRTNLVMADGASVYGLIIVPDNYTGDLSESTTWSSWQKMETAGCVFLPAAGYRAGSDVFYAGNNGNYWTSTISGNTPRGLSFHSSRVNPQDISSRFYGCSVRLVHDVEE